MRVQPVRDRGRRHVHGLPAASAECIAVESSGSTPTTRACRRGDRDARDQPAAPDRHDDRLDALDVLEDLEPDRPLPGDRQRVVERMDERAAGLVEQQREALERLGRAECLEVDRRAVTPRRGDLRLARPGPHDDECVEPLLGGGATACAWLPAEIAMTPLARSSR